MSMYNKRDNLLTQVLALFFKRYNMDKTNDVIQPTEEVEQPTEQAEQPAETLSTLINELTDKYEARISAIVKKYDASIAERDDVIKQLLTGESVQEQSIADRINARRNFKKW